LPSVNKTKHPNKGKKRYKMEGFKSRQKEGTTNEGRPQGKHEQIKYSKLPSQGAYQIKRKKEHPKNT
jgi:hypothetical protein